MVFWAFPEVKEKTTANIPSFEAFRNQKPRFCDCPIPPAPIFPRRARFMSAKCPPAPEAFFEENLDSDLPFELDTSNN